MLALTAAQAALAKHIEPGNRDAEETLNTILGVLDHDTVLQAEIRKLHAIQVKRLFSNKTNKRTFSKFCGAHLGGVGSKKVRDKHPARSGHHATA